MRPANTYRLQFHEAFTFDDARAIVPYLDALGVSHIYASPYLKARAGSRHGYDIVDHAQLNPEVGHRDAFEALTAALHERRMGQILDFVPNHMGVGGTENAWWLDVLEWGENSPYAAFFDIEWRPLRPELQGKVLVAMLGDLYGTTLHNGEIALRYDELSARVSAWYYEHQFPLKPGTYATLLRASGNAALGALAPEFSSLDRIARSATARAALRSRADGARERLRGALRDSAVRAAFDAVLARYNGVRNDPHSFAELDALLRVQHYRIAYWKVAAEEINYRRFFDINGLAALRMENPECFAVAHQLVFELIACGAVDGLRIDHVDGLFNPETYCQLLRSRAEMLDQNLYLVVEKILARGESLPRTWGVDGTTGYEYASSVGGLYVKGTSEDAFDRLYARFTGHQNALNDIVYACKRHIMDVALASELNVLAWNLDRIAQTDPSSRDYTLYGLRSALKEIVACFPVYRTYVTSEAIAPEDRGYIETAITEARRRNPFADASIYAFIAGILTADVLHRDDTRYDRRAVLRFAMRFQQFSAPVMAKGLEDTAFYRYNRLVSLNEVGGDPGRFGTSVASFHRANRVRAESWPGAMVATATHDTKRGEDARMRLNVLSEIPVPWSRAIDRWRRANAPLHDGGVPGANEEYLLYQALVGAWPMEFVGRESLTHDELAPLRERIAAYAVKAVREAKVYSSWASPDAAYEDSLQSFVAAILDPARAERFIADLARFMTTVARVGAWSSLAQSTLKLTGPGVPDTYQGTECWDLSLVDPDNRRHVDYAARAAMLAALPRPGSGPEPLAELLETWPDGRVKLFVTSALLRRRREHPPSGGYVPIFGAGPRASHVVAFAYGDLIVAVPRLIATLLGAETAPPIGEPVWHSTTLRVPERLRGRYRNLFTGAIHTVDAPGGMARVPVAEVLADFPVAAIVRI